MPLSRIPDAGVAALAASKLTGQVPDANAPSGSVIQVVQFSTAATGTVGNSFAQAPGPFQATITPISTTSRICIQIVAHTGCGSSDGRYAAFTVRRNGVDIAVGNRGGNNGTNVSFAANRDAVNAAAIANSAFVFIDEPATTAALTYSLWWRADFIGGTRIAYFNRPEDLGDAMRHWTTSTMILTEIAG